MKRPFKVIQLYKALGSGETLLPTDTGFTFWEETYEAAPAVFDREFARRYTSFDIFDFMDAENISDAKDNFKADILSILTFNKKRYEEMYRVFLVEDADDPITYNYDMVETTGAQHTESVKGEQENTIGEQINTTGEQENTIGQQSNTIGQQSNTIGSQTVTTSKAVADTSNLKTASQDETSARNDNTGQRIDIEGERSDTYGERIDTEGARTDIEGARTDTYDADEWTLTRRGNIGVQTAADILRLHTEYWTEIYKFFNLIYDDIAKQLLMVGD